jgi:hypothetical protein
MGHGDEISMVHRWLMYILLSWSNVVFLHCMKRNGSLILLSDSSLGTYSH